MSKFKLDIFNGPQPIVQCRFLVSSQYICVKIGHKQKNQWGKSSFPCLLQGEKSHFAPKQHKSCQWLRRLWFLEESLKFWGLLRNQTAGHSWYEFLPLQMKMAILRWVEKNGNIKVVAGWRTVEVRWEEAAIQFLTKTHLASNQSSTHHYLFSKLRIWKFFFYFELENIMILWETYQWRST